MQEGRRIVLLSFVECFLLPASQQTFLTPGYHPSHTTPSLWFGSGQFGDDGPCVVFASPGMLQSGVSRRLFDRWASNPKNGVVIAGYAVENTLAKDLAKEPEEVVTLEGKRQPLNCIVEYVSFSAHVDFVQNRDFITAVNPGRIVLVHGQKVRIAGARGVAHDKAGGQKRAPLFLADVLSSNSPHPPSLSVGAERDEETEDCARRALPEGVKDD